jgi:hypothetical protein
VVPKIGQAWEMQASLAVTVIPGKSFTQMKNMFFNFREMVNFLHVKRKMAVFFT